jgi:hypothetical protein
MKKLFTSIVFIISAFFLYAQLPITKTALLGTWQISSINVPNMYYFDFTKDSIVMLHKSMSSTSEGEVFDIIQQTKMKKNIAKAFIKDGKRNLMIFNADSVLSGFTVAEAIGTTYSLDENKGILIMEHNPTKEYPAIYPMEFIASISKKNQLVLVMDVKGTDLKMTMEYDKVE